MTTTPAEQPLAVTTNDEEIDLREVVNALRRRWPLLLGGVLLVS